MIVKARRNTARYAKGRSVSFGCLNGRLKDYSTMVFQSEASLKDLADFLAFVCRTKSQHVFCPAKHIPDFLCPLGDDGICENMKPSDWETELKRQEGGKH